SSKAHLRKHIEAYTRAYNQNHKPFIWRKREVKGSQLKNNIDNLSN
ncbi:MAG: IS630 family transposase, partial [Bacteroidota bacterium]